VILCKIAAAEYDMIISNHHIIYDGWSNGIILGEFFNVYQAISQDEVLPALPAKTPFKDFVRWQRQQDAVRQKNFWLSYLNGFMGKTNLCQKSSKKFGNKAIEIYRLTLNPELWAKLQEIVSQYKVTLACLFYGTWGLVLQRHCCCENVIFGTAVSGRNIPLKDSEDMVGVFINTIPLRVQHHLGETTLDFFACLNRQLQEREEFQHTWMGDIKMYIQAKSNEDFFDSIVIIENYPLEHAVHGDYDGNLNPDNLRVTGFDAFDVKTSYPLTLVIKLFDRVAINMNFLPEAFETGVVKKLWQDFIMLLEILPDEMQKEMPAEIHEEEIEEEEINIDFNL
ncbi:MAG: condensation domain-containing protein, partial [Acidobacteria bacterium]|nr:condensation domain-containing protein [Acidobacteriota bacterium]